MKSLEKDRSRRYETANGFAADVQRYLKMSRWRPPAVGVVSPAQGGEATPSGPDGGGQGGCRTGLGRGPCRGARADGAVEFPGAATPARPALGHPRGGRTRRGRWRGGRRRFPATTGGSCKRRPRPRSGGSTPAPSRPCRSRPRSEVRPPWLSPVHGRPGGTRRVLGCPDRPARCLRPGRGRPVRLPRRRHGLPARVVAWRTRFGPRPRTQPGRRRAPAGDAGGLSLPPPLPGTSRPTPASSRPA